MGGAPLYVKPFLGDGQCEKLGLVKVSLWLVSVTENATMDSVILGLVKASFRWDSNDCGKLEDGKAKARLGL